MGDARIDKMLQPTFDRLRVAAMEFAESLDDLQRHLDESMPNPPPASADTSAQADDGGTTPDFDPTDNGSVACPTRDCIADRGHRGPCLIKPDHDAVQRENLRTQADGGEGRG